MMLSIVQNNLMRGSSWATKSTYGAAKLSSTSGTLLGERSHTTQARRRQLQRALQALGIFAVAAKKILDDLVQQSRQLVDWKRNKSTVSWQVDNPHNQPCYNFVDNEWKTQVKSSLAISSKIVKITLYSWNIDFRIPFGDSPPDQDSTATVIYLQKCVRNDLEIIAADDWIRKTFALADVGIKNWQSSHYGTISLIDRRLPIPSCFRVHNSKTRMARDGLFVDVLFKDKTVRLCNTHLESLALESPCRIPQMQVCASFMHKPEVHGALLAGDLNAIQQFDRTLHSDNELKDAYLERGGVEDDAAGHTWGQQAATSQREQFGTRRMDKVYFCGCVELLSFEKFGADVLVEDPAGREELVRYGFDAPWITDHLGVKAVVRIPLSLHPSGKM